MAESPPKLVNELRAKTGQGMMECKKILTEAGGDIEKAIDIPQEGREDVARTSAPPAKARRRREPTDSKRALVEINCNTDFTAKSEPFLKLAQDAAQCAARSNPAADVATDAAVNANHHRGFAERPAKTSTSARPPSLTAPPAERSALYLYGTPERSACSWPSPATPRDELVKHLGVHIASARPFGLTRAEVPADLVAKEKEIAVEAGQGHRQAAGDRRENRRRKAQQLLRRARPARPGILQRLGLQRERAELPEAEQRRAGKVRAA